MDALIQLAGAKWIPLATHVHADTHQEIPPGLMSW